jgi:hypothetical protein
MRMAYAAVRRGRSQPRAGAGGACWPAGSRREDAPPRRPSRHPGTGCAPRRPVRRGDPKRSGCPRRRRQRSSATGVRQAVQLRPATAIPARRPCGPPLVRQASPRPRCLRHRCHRQGRLHRRAVRCRAARRAPRRSCAGVVGHPSCAGSPRTRRMADDPGARAPRTRGASGIRSGFARIRTLHRPPVSGASYRPACRAAD